MKILLEFVFFRYPAEKLFSKSAVDFPSGKITACSQPRSSAFGGHHARSASETFSQTTFPPDYANNARISYKLNNPV